MFSTFGYFLASCIHWLVKFVWTIKARFEACLRTDASSLFDSGSGVQASSEGQVKTFKKLSSKERTITRTVIRALGDFRGKGFSNGLGMGLEMRVKL